MSHIEATGTFKFGKIVEMICTGCGKVTKCPVKSEEDGMCPCIRKARTEALPDEYAGGFGDSFK